MKEYRTIRINKKAWEQLAFLAGLYGRTVLSQFDFIVREAYAAELIAATPRGAAQGEPVIPGPVVSDARI